MQHGHAASLNDLDGAEDHLRPVLRLPTESRTFPVVQRMSKAGSAISSTRFAGSPMAAELREQIALFFAYTATRELPAPQDQSAGTAPVTSLRESHGITSRRLRTTPLHRGGQG